MRGEGCGPSEAQSGGEHPGGPVGAARIRPQDTGGQRLRPDGGQAPGRTHVGQRVADACGTSDVGVQEGPPRRADVLEPGLHRVDDLLGLVDCQQPQGQRPDLVRAQGTARGSTHWSLPAEVRSSARVRAPATSVRM